MSSTIQQSRIRRTFVPSSGGGVVQPPPVTDTSIPFRTPRMASHDVVRALLVNIHVTYSGSPYRNIPAVMYQRLRELRPGGVREGIIAPNNSVQRNALAQISGTDKMDISFIIGRSESPGTAVADINAGIGEIANWYGGANGHTQHGKVRYIEGWNEPNNFGTANWAADSKEMQPKLYQAAKANPLTAALPVTSPSLAWNGTTAPYDDMGDLSAYCDLGNLHYYTGGNMPEFGFGAGPHNLVSLGTLATKSRPQILTESGGHTLQNAKSFRKDSAGNVTITGNDGHLWTPPEVMGTYGPRYLLGPMWGGVQSVATYELFDRDNSDRTINKERNFGMLTPTGEPKPLFHALKNLSAVFYDANPVTHQGYSAPMQPVQIDWKVNGSAPPSEFRHWLTQRSDGSYLLVMWLAKSVWRTAYAAPYPANLITVPAINVTITLGRSSNVTFTRPSDPVNAAAPVNGVTSFTVPVGADVQIAKIAAV